MAFILAWYFAAAVGALATAALASKNTWAVLPTAVEIVVEILGPSATSGAPSAFSALAAADDPLPAASSAETIFFWLDVDTAEVGTPFVTTSSTRVRALVMLSCQPFTALQNPLAHAVVETVFASATGAATVMMPAHATTAVATMPSLLEVVPISELPSLERCGSEG